MDFKQCSSCEKVLPGEQFALRKSSTGTWWIQGGRCRPCVNKRKIERLGDNYLLGTKRCRSCKIEKPKVEFAHKITQSGGVDNYCNPCRAERRREVEYGITPEQYDGMLAEQDNRCYLCKQSETAIHPRTGKIKRLSVDHCHSSGNVRRLLCSACNIGLGSFKDDPALLRAAALYLEENGLAPLGEEGEK